MFSFIFNIAIVLIIVFFGAGSILVMSDNIKRKGSI